MAGTVCLFSLTGLGRNLESCTCNFVELFNLQLEDFKVALYVLILLIIMCVPARLFASLHAVSSAVRGPLGTEVTGGYGSPEPGASVRTVRTVNH